LFIEKKWPSKEKVSISVTKTKNEEKRGKTAARRHRLRKIEGSPSKQCGKKKKHRTSSSTGGWEEEKISPSAQSEKEKARSVQKKR